MDKDEKLINHLLLEASDSSEALSSFNRLKKSRSDRWSMQAACKRMGIPSTGYFSDVLKGKRRLHPKYVSGAKSAFELNEAHTAYFEALVLRDQDDRDEARRQWTEELEKRSAPLRMEYIPIPKSLSEGLHWHILVLSAFSLFGGSPTLRDLSGFFGKALTIPLSKSLHRMMEMGLVEIEGERYRLAKTRLIFKDAEDGFSHIEFLEKSIAHAGEQVKAWYPKTEQSIFVSSVVTVRSEDFVRKMPDIRSRIHAILNEINSSEGDQLVEFNLQLFPFHPRDLNPS